MMNRVTDNRIVQELSFKLLRPALLFNYLQLLWVRCCTSTLNAVFLTRSNSFTIVPLRGNSSNLRWELRLTK